MHRGEGERGRKGEKEGGREGREKGRKGGRGGGGGGGGNSDTRLNVRNAHLLVYYRRDQECEHGGTS